MSVDTSSQLAAIMFYHYAANLCHCMCAACCKIFGAVSAAMMADMHTVYFYGYAGASPTDRAFGAAQCQ